MKVLVLFDSQFGNTRQIAEAIAGVLQEHGEIQMLPADETALAAAAASDLLILGSPTQAHGLSPVMRDLCAKLPPAARQGVVALAFDTRYRKARWLTGSAASVIAEKLEQHGYRLLAPPESFFVLTREGPLEDGERARAATWAREAVGRAALPIPVAGQA